MKIALFGLAYQSPVTPYVEQLFQLLKVNEIETWVYKSFDDFLSEQMELGERRTFSHRDELPSDIAFMLSLGGDGTMLSAVNLLRDSEIPVTGINLGRLGFLASINKIGRASCRERV